jgi:hypothetical protein
MKTNQIAWDKNGFQRVTKAETLQEIISEMSDRTERSGGEPW